MSNTKFTPGPWRVWTTTQKLLNTQTNASVEINRFKVVAETGQEIADVQRFDQDNARLIASAPSMHSLLESVLSHFKATGMSREESELNTEICKLLSKIGGAE